MFRGKTAWFSSSVPATCYWFWKSEGGKLAGCGTADYLFSSDASCPDTLRMFESKDYLWNKVTVFHSSVLQVCERRKSVKSVCMGHYVLPPAAVQREVRGAVGKFIWEHTVDPPVAQVLHGSHDGTPDETEHSPSEADTCSQSKVGTSERGELLCHEVQDHFASCNMCPGYISMDKLQKYSGSLCDFCPGCSK